MGLSFLIIAGVVVVSTDLLPVEWQIPGEGWAVIFPLV